MAGDEAEAFLEGVFGGVLAVGVPAGGVLAGVEAGAGAGEGGGGVSAGGGGGDPQPSGSASGL